MKYYNLLVISDLNLDNLNKKKDNIEIIYKFKDNQYGILTDTFRIV